eukprot:TRINITY_DN1427_c0_g2_i2.p1 TRINITY_DN1427_c0_g2~~TRINITY_DN1427_c0_g2_i2.p1  ORF type:complete len:105 (+),score=11.21 TRINITY_DN1427_c0_g2_i2:106-420(+)
MGTDSHKMQVSIGPSSIEIVGDDQRKTNPQFPNSRMLMIQTIFSSFLTKGTYTITSIGLTMCIPYECPTQTHSLFLSHKWNVAMDVTDAHHERQSYMWVVFIWY